MNVSSHRPYVYPHIFRFWTRETIVFRTFSNYFFIKKIFAKVTTYVLWIFKFPHKVFCCKGLTL